MKKNKKMIWIIGITVALIVAAGLAQKLKFKYEISKMSPLESQEIISGIYVIKNDYANFYIVKTNNGYIAIDAGISIEHSEEELLKLNINPDDVTTVFLTHTDLDHIGAVKLFKSAVIYIAKEEEQMINGQTPRQFIFNNKMDSPYTTLESGEKTVVSNLEVEGILTPGHTPGSMSYLVDGKYLFTGDTLSLIDGKVECQNPYFNMDTKLQEETLKRLASRTPAEYVFTGHYGYTDNYDQAFQKWK